MKRMASIKEGRLIPSGIPFFDGQLGGGYGKNKLIAVAGGTASGKTLFALQTFLARKFTDGSRGLIISSEESREELKDIARRFSFRTGKNLCIEGVSGGIPEITGMLKKYAAGKHVCHLFINSLALPGNPAENGSSLLGLLGLLSQLRWNTVLACNTKSDFLGKRFPDDSLFERADGFIFLKRNFSEGEESFGVKILKLRAAEFEKDEKHLFWKPKGLRSGKKALQLRRNSRKYSLFQTPTTPPSKTSSPKSSRGRIPGGA